jgi:hypothetical protein
MTATCATAPATATAAAAIEDAAALRDAAVTKDAIADATLAAATASAAAPATAPASAAATAEAASFSKKRKAVAEAVGEKDALVASLNCIIAKKRKAQAAINAAVDVKDALLAEFNSVMARYTDACATVGRCQAALAAAGDSWQSALARAATLSEPRRYEPTSIDYIPTSPTHRSAASDADSDSDDSVASPRIAANGAPRCKAIKWP